MSLAGPWVPPSYPCLRSCVSALRDKSRFACEKADGMDLWPLSLERRRQSGSSAVSTQVGSYGSRVTCLRSAEFELVKLPFRCESAIGRRARA